MPRRACSGFGPPSANVLCGTCLESAGSPRTASGGTRHRARAKHAVPAQDVSVHAADGIDFGRLNGLGMNGTGRKHAGLECIGSEDPVSLGRGNIGCRCWKAYMGRK